MVQGLVTSVVMLSRDDREPAQSVVLVIWDGEHWYK